MSIYFVKIRAGRYARDPLPRARRYGARSLPLAPVVANGREH